MPAPVAPMPTSAVPMPAPAAPAPAARLTMPVSNQAAPATAPTPAPAEKRTAPHPGVRRATALAAGAVALVAVGVVAYAAPGASAGEAGKDPDQIFRDMVSTMAGLHSYHLSQSGQGDHGASSEELSVRAPDTATGTVSVKDVTAQSIIVGNNAYMQGAAFFRQMFPEVAPALGDRWVRVADQAQHFTFGSPSSIARCMPLEQGTLTKGTVTTVAGQRAIELIDGGDRPGSGVGSYAVQLEGPHYLLRMNRSGGTRAGGAAACGDVQAGTATFTVDFDRFNASVAPITVPTGAIDMPSAGQVYVTVLRADYQHISSAVAEEAKVCQSTASACYQVLLRARATVQQTADDIAPLKPPQSLQGADGRVRAGLSTLVPDIDAMINALLSGNQRTLLSAARKAQVDGVQVDAAVAQILQATPPGAAPSPGTASGGLSA